MTRADLARLKRAKRTPYVPTAAEAAALATVFAKALGGLAVAAELRDNAAKLTPGWSIAGAEARLNFLSPPVV